jgi:site-specific recombinase XerD
MQKRAVVFKRKPWRAAASERHYTRNQIAAAAASWQRLLRGFATWLEQDRGLALSTITVRVTSARMFTEALGGRGGVATLSGLGVADIEDFFVDYAADHGPAARRSMQATLRLLLRFAAQRGWVKPQLAEAVPSMQRYRFSGVPRGLSREQVRALIATSAKGSLRNHAIVLLLAVYGIRRGQISALVLEDIDWRGHTITFGAHKGGKTVQHRLAPAVAAALSEYIRHERPRSREQAVFLRGRPPHLALGPAAVTHVVHTEIRKSGMTCSPAGPHALRHAFATRLLHDGQPLKVIADLLGHRSLAEVSTYAKVDHPRLLEVAAPWPEVGS